MPTLANPAVEVNDKSIKIIPNTFSYKTGRGNTNLRAQSAGGDKVDVVKTVDAETKKGMAKFSLITTKTNVDLVEGWQVDGDGVTIDASEGDFNVAFENMHVMEDPEITTGAEGTIEVVFEGKPAV